MRSPSPSESSSAARNSRILASAGSVTWMIGSGIVSDIVIEATGLPPRSVLSEDAAPGVATAHLRVRRSRRWGGAQAAAGQHESSESAGRAIRVESGRAAVDVDALAVHVAGTVGHQPPHDVG